MNKYLRSFVLLGLASALAQTVQAQQADTLSRVFRLGEISIKGNRDSLRSSKIGSSIISRYNRMDVSRALNLMPGVTLSAVGPRNESAVSIHGFDMRQVPIYLDGMPLYVPYDGYVDLARYTTFNLSEIQVAKGYSSVLYGPNAEGGAINLITRKPVNPFEADVVAGWLNGGYRLSTNIGSNFGKIYYQLSASQLKQDYVPMSRDFNATANEDGGRRNNSYRDDIGFSGKIGFTPTVNQEYVVGYSYQHGKKGTPVYTGTDTQNALFRNPRFWKWPKWDTQSLYVLSNNKINETNVIKTRWYYNQFKNQLESYDNAEYSTMLRPYAFTSIYDDYTLGTSVTYENTDVKNNNFSLAGHFKQDVHREHNVGEPTRRAADQNYTFGAEDTYHLTPKLKLNAGVSYMDRQSDGAEQYNSTTKVVSNLPENKNSAWNVQGLVQYDIDSTQLLSFSVARKTRFATIKDRYSYRMGTALPNPDLKAENALNYNLVYQGHFFSDLSLEASAFYSKLQNTIQSVSNVAVDPVTNVALAQAQNVGRAAYYGAEAGLGYQLMPALRMDANYTLTIRKNKSNPLIFLTDVPKNKVFASVSYQPVKRVSVIASEEYNSRRYSTSYGTIAGSFYLTNARVQIELIKGFSVDGGVNNIFDLNYQLVEGFPEAGRNYFANLHYTF